MLQVEANFYSAQGLFMNQDLFVCEKSKEDFDITKTVGNNILKALLTKPLFEEIYKRYWS